MTALTRRSALRGLLGGGSVTLALPFLDCFLDSNGSALAASGAPLPNRFSTWFWGCGLSTGQWEPKQTGAKYEISPQLKPLAPYRDQMTVFSGMRSILDGNALIAHTSGVMGVLVGTTGKENDPSIDQIVADQLGSSTRFRSLEVAACGSPTHTQSRRSASVVNPSEVSPLALYARLFGPEFKDPNAADFTPDPRVMAEKSVLSALKDQRDALAARIGAADKARLDEYYTSIRQIENELALQLEKPAPLEACTVPKEAKETEIATDVEVATANHRLFARMLVHAIACDQTRVFNVSFTDGPSSLRRAGEAPTQHIRTHEDGVDPVLGYQIGANFFENKILLALSQLIAELKAVREGDGTLLDRTLVLAMSETGLARNHTLENIPVFLIGGAGGRLKSGMHIEAKGEPISRIGLTIQQSLGIGVGSWGRGSMNTRRPFTELQA